MPSINNKNKVDSLRFITNLRLISNLIKISKNTEYKV